jgi:hypothetical protein
MNTRIVLDLQSDLSLTGATFSEPVISSPTGLVQGDISGLTSSLNNLSSKDMSIDLRITAEESTRSSVDISLTTRVSSEESTTTSSDTSLSTRISSETSARSTEDDAQSGRINSFSSGSYQYVEFTGLTNDINTVFTNISTDLGSASFTQVYLNGLLQDSADYTASFGSANSTITFNDAPEVGAKIKVLVFWVPSLSYDPDATAFFLATGITDSTQKSAVNQLVLNLKSYGLWTKMYAIYPIVGGSATTHKFNLKNPLNTDASYRLVFNGGWVHSSTGILGNGTNTFANTFLGINVLPQNNAHISFYSRTNSNGNYIDIGSYYTTINFNSVMLARMGGNFVARLNTSQFVDASTSNSNSQGFYQAIRNNSTQISTKKNGNAALTFSNNSASASGYTFPYYLGNAQFNGGVLSGYYSNREYAFFSLGEGLTTTESGNFYTTVQTYQTTLGRQV